MHWECSVGHVANVQVMDLGSLNGTSLNGRIISTSNRRRSRLWRLNDGDEIKLGVRSTLKITYLPLQDGSVRPSVLRPCERYSRPPLREAGAPSSIIARGMCMMPARAELCKSADDVVGWFADSQSFELCYNPMLELQDGISRAPAQVMLGRALLKIPTMPSEAFAAISLKLTSSSSSSSMDSHLLVRNTSLRMEAWVASRTGREHVRLGMVGLRTLLPLVV